MSSTTEGMLTRLRETHRCLTGLRPQIKTSSGAFHCFFAHESFYVVSGRAWGDVYRLQIWETVEATARAFPYGDSTAGARGIHREE